MIKKYNLSKPEKYMSNGVEKTFWANVGTMTEFEKQDGSVSRIVEIPAIGLKASVFLQEPKENAPQRPQPRTVATKPTPTPKENLDIEYPEEDINPEDIPF
jgi:hypothetical protein